MAEQIPTTGQLENAQRIVLTEAQYTAEHAAPMVNLVQHYRLGQGEKSLIVPKVGQMAAAALTPGVDMTDSQEIGMTTVELTTGEIGLKVILDDGLVLQANDNITSMVGKQMGDAISRYTEEEILALFVALNGGTAYGADNISFTARNFANAIATARANKFGSSLFAVHHSNAIMALTGSLAPIGATGSVAVPTGFSADLLGDFFRVTLSGVPVFEANNIAKITGTDSGYGVIAHKGAMAVLDSMEPSVRPQRDESLRATELNMVARHGVFEVDDTLGAALRYEIGDLSTAN